MKLDDDLDQQDYFLIQEQKLKIGCRDCEIEKMPALRILFSSDSFIRQGDNLYYYLELPQSDLKIHQFQVSHFGPGDKILSPVKTVKFRQSNRFPNVPVPNLHIVQIEDEKKIIRFSFGKVVLKKITVVDDVPEKLLEQKKDKEIANFLKIDYWTTIVVYKNNKEIYRSIGETDKSEIYSAIKKGV